MKKNLLLSLSVSMLSIGSFAAADYTASYTDYTKAKAAQEKWTEDMANEFVSMPNSFACIIAKSALCNCLCQAGRPAISGYICY